MFSAFSDVNWLAVLVSTVVSIAIAGIYFAVLTPKLYLRVLGRDESEPAPQSALTAVGPLVCIAATVVTSAVLITALDLTTVGDALSFGLIVGVGYLVAMTFQIAINPNFPHPVQYGLLNLPFFLLSSLVSSVILVLW